jgi:hypothetical protein
MGEVERGYPQMGLEDWHLPRSEEEETLESNLHLGPGEEERCFF